MRMFNSKDKNKHRDEYENIYSNDFSKRNNITKGDCLCCNEKNSMRQEQNIFVCRSCGHSVDEEIYYRWLSGEHIEIETVYDESYEAVYDESGDYVFCDYCGEEIKWKDGVYICPNCKQTMSRSEFFNYVGAEPLGEKCIECDNVYPGCVICPYGYIED